MHILLVEDEPNIAAYVQRGLKENGYAVDVAFTGTEALDWSATEAFDLVVLDVLLPEIDGFSVCRELRRRGFRQPVLMLTARDAVGDRVTGLDAGADDYLVKPFALEELLARLRALSRRAGEAPKTTVMQVADLAVDTATRRVTRAGRPIDITAKEFAVLECLMRSPGRVLSRTQIADHVWSYEDYPESNVVEVYVRNLRRRIDDDHEIKLIHTIRGAGYRLCADP